MMIGAVPTSVPQFILLGNWLIEGNFKNKWQQLKPNRIFWLLSAVFAMHVLGLLYTADLKAGIAQFQITMPLFAMAFIFFSTAPLSEKEFHGMLYCFLAGCFCNTAWCLIYSFVLHHNEVVRDASRFMSHIRLGMYLNMAIATCVYFAVKAKRIFSRLSMIALALYFISTMLILGLASGLSGFFILLLFCLCVVIYRQRAIIKIALLAVIAVLAIAVAGYILKINNAQLAVKPTLNNTLLTRNAAGRELIYLDTLGQKENGNYVWINLQVDELRDEWNRQFPQDTFSYNPNPHNLGRFDVLVRYLASKGMNKDSAALAQLSTEDKTNIQKGISNYQYSSWSFLHKRTYELVNEYDDFKHHRNVNGHSLTMRLYFWQAALHVIKQHFFTGVGTGDVQDELNKAYAETHSPLEKDWYKRPHNQFLTISVAFGIFGLLLFIVSIVYPVVALKAWLPKLFWPFLIIVIISFLLEDTLETQAGITFYVFFNTLFLSVAWFRRRAGLNRGGTAIRRSSE